MEQASYIAKASKDEWIIGSYITDRQDPAAAYIGYHLIDNGTIPCPSKQTDFCPMNIIKVVPETVCACSGATAKEGKEIWEKDIVDYNGAVGVVKFGKYGNGFHYGFYIDWITCPDFRNELLFWEGKVKIIGNIIDNPELIPEIQGKG